MKIARISSTAVADLARRVRGPVLLPGQDGYDRERAGFNQAVDHHPALVVGAAEAADVQAAVGFAVEHGLPLAVQATGHGASIPADGALLISTRRMDGVRIDPRRRSARIEAGVRWQQVIERAAEVGLAPLNGSSPLVGAVSYTLGGGLPVLGRTHGWAADHVRGIEVVTADGRLRTATPDRYGDLFWALRGGKGNFGVVTSLEIGLVAVSRLYGGGLYFPGEAAGGVLHAWRRWTASVPEELTSSVALLRLPDLPDLPAPLRGRFVVHVRIAYLGSAARGEELLRPLREIGGRIADTVGDMPYRAVAAIHADPTEPTPYHERSMMLRELPGPAVDTLLELAGPGADCPIDMVELRHLGGALARTPEVPNATGNRAAAYSLSAVSPAGPQQTDEVTGYPELLLQRMTPWSTGRSFLNFLGGPDTAGQVRDAYAPEDWARLTGIKAVYDPDNLFRINHNIPPTSL
ncbi:FAD-binding oxidoreductase [Streptosporangium sp. NPDC006013]|uniref:FAD-binding oxidoreductase n=1 Tax=Streptosporangium sp. NPDC006013 TaxID=3155596 RepID=UPI0033AEE34D